jgi:predicted Zn-dependent peptidase
MLSMELTSTRMSRLGKSLITDSELLDLDRILAEIEAVDVTAVAELAQLLYVPSRLSAAAIGPSEERFLQALEHISPDLVPAAAA